MRRMMKCRRINICAGMILLCLFMVVGLVACGISRDELDLLCERFLGCVIADDYDSAYGMAEGAVSDGDFRAYWQEIRAVAEGAESYEVQNTEWQSGTVGDALYATATYLVYLSNGKTAVLRITARTDYSDIADIHFSDVTDFLANTETTVSVVRVILLVISALSILFAIWMFVDCLRRRMRYKALWAILITFGTTVIVTVGQGFNLHFDVGVILRTATATSDPMLMAVVAKVTIPLGAILYLCLHKKFEVDPGEPADSAPAEPAEAETNDQD